MIAADSVRSLLALSFVIVAACAGANQDQAKMQSAVPVPITGLAVLGVGDIFEIRVFGEPDLSGEFSIAADGTIDFPLVGKVVVDGLNASQLSGLLSQKLERYMKKPDVSVFVKQITSKKVFVFGEVKAPGTFPYEQNMNIIQAITLAGGFERLADQDGTFVTRVVDGREQRLRVPVKSIGRGDATNFSLQPGDIVFVPERLF